ncbi:FecCD family ABC transporter permease [Candidatus Methanomassiliicoccus intestinalis]|uniref:FecCD family ABC transporter permease n=1 Tax=Candidatus Methanomassiliicoccus intestinalis TaxID=1406512 RepID=UPI0037DD9A5D
MSFSKHQECDPQKEKLKRMITKRVLFISISIITAIILVGYSITVGASQLTAIEAYKVLINKIIPGLFEIPDNAELIIMNIRAPRVLMAVFAGMILAIGGCLVQTLLTNPLATPYTLGVSSGAGFGAAISIIYGVSIVSTTLGTITNAFLFSLIPVAVILIGSRHSKMTPLTIVLCGVAISYIFSACNTILQYFADANAVKEVVFWSIGDLSHAQMWQIPYVAAMAIFFFVIAMVLSKDINLIRMGDDSAKSLGVNVNGVRLVAIVLSCLATATVVSFIGAIGFVCLLAPHIARIFVGGDLRYLIPASAAFGACLLLIADILAKSLISPVLLPVGAITALLGGPVLVYLLLRPKGANTV